MKLRDLLHHFAHVAAFLADGQHSHRDDRGEAVGFHRFGDGAAFVDCPARHRQPRAQQRVQQLRAHPERGRERRAALEEHPDGAVETRKLVQLEALADRG